MHPRRLPIRLDSSCSGLATSRHHVGLHLQINTSPTVLTYFIFPVVLASDFKLTDGRVEVTVPNVYKGDDYSLVCEYSHTTSVLSRHSDVIHLSIRWFRQLGSHILNLWWFGPRWLISKVRTKLSERSFSPWASWTLGEEVVGWSESLANCSIGILDEFLSWCFCWVGIRTSRTLKSCTF